MDKRALQDEIIRLKEIVRMLENKQHDTEARFRELEKTTTYQKIVLGIILKVGLGLIIAIMTLAIKAFDDSTATKSIFYFQRAETNICI